MKKVIISEEDHRTIHVDKVDSTMNVFAKDTKTGRLCGMVMYEGKRGRVISAGWILRFNSGAGYSGHHESIKDCITSCSDRYEFFVED